MLLWFAKCLSFLNLKYLSVVSCKVCEKKAANLITTKARSHNCTFLVLTAIIFFPRMENAVFLNNVKDTTEWDKPQMKILKGAWSLCVVHQRYKQSIRIFKTLIFNSKTFTWTNLTVTLYVYCVYCCSLNRELNQDSITICSR